MSKTYRVLALDTADVLALAEALNVLADQAEAGRSLAQRYELRNLADDLINADEIRYPEED